MFNELAQFPSSPFSKDIFPNTIYRRVWVFFIPVEYVVSVVTSVDEEKKWRIQEMTFFSY